MSIVIVGAGAIGSLFAALLSQGPKPVVLLDHNPDRAKLLRQNGIRVIRGGIEDIFRVESTVDSGCLNSAEFIIIAVKAYHTGAIADMFSRNLKHSSVKLIVTIQNGLGNVEMLQRHVNPALLAVGSTYHAATYEGPGHIIHTGQGSTCLAPVLRDSRAKVDELIEYLKMVGLDASYSDDYMSLLWSKVIVNCAINPVTALTRLRNGEVADRPRLFKIMGESALEAYRVALALGVTPEYDDPVGKVMEVAKQTYHNKSSMLQDIERKRKTEVDYINGAVVSMAEKYGVSVPVNTILHSLVRGLENGLSYA